MSDMNPLPPPMAERGSPAPDAAYGLVHRGLTPGEGDPADNKAVPGTVHFGITTRDTPGTPGNDGPANTVPHPQGNAGA